MAKSITLNLVEWSSWWDEKMETKRKPEEGARRCFLVDSMKNTIDYKAGDLLTEAVVKDLTKIEGINVNIRQPKDSDYRSSGRP